MKKSLFVFSLFFILAMAAQAQDRAFIEQYFQSVLQGEKPSEIPAERIKRAKMEC